MGNDKVIAVIGLGYVGLPLAVEFGKYRKVIGFDINPARIAELKTGKDHTLEVSSEELIQSKHIVFSHQAQDLFEAQIFVVTVPTPIDRYNQPDLSPLLKASQLIASVLKKGDIVIYESTVYPGCTEEDCVPVLEKYSGLTYNHDFFCGYSPERMNPGDKDHSVTKIKKVTAGSTPEIAAEVDALYASIITAGTHLASSIKVAEASKIIENSQRDVNIAFVNELSLIFEKMGIDTHEVLAAAGTKWNFMPFRPGLVGGHCIGVDPYYLTHKAESLGYHPQVILAGRRINDNMGSFIANRVVKLMVQKNHLIHNSRILILGITFKENCPDIRNSKVLSIYSELRDFGIQVDIYDPWANAAEVAHEYNVQLISQPTGLYDAIILTVGHDVFHQLNLTPFKKDNTVVFDVKAFLPLHEVTARL
ncbi:MAG: nucleotide sugar dehydrogenase [Sphingobacteriia bacterium]|nr:nucleotide sugar dehydrogenase [Sphingobacteriia bacterium]